MAEDGIEPHGEERGDYQAALVAWVVAAVNGAKKLEVGDFAGLLAEELRKAGRAKEPPTAEELKLKAMALCAAMGGSVDGRPVGPPRFEHPPLPRVINPGVP